jgi:hypothetical protein
MKQLGGKDQVMIAPHPTLSMRNLVDCLRYFSVVVLGSSTTVHSGHHGRPNICRSVFEGVPKGDHSISKGVCQGIDCHCFQELPDKAFNPDISIAVVFHERCVH